MTIPTYKLKIYMYILVCILLSGCSLKMKHANLLNIIENDQVLYIWKQKGTLELLGLNVYSDTEKSGTIFEKREGVVSKAYFQYPSGKEIMLGYFGDYTYPKKLTQSNDKNTLHLFYFAGISQYRYRVIEFNIQTGQIKNYGLPEDNEYYSF